MRRMFLKRKKNLAGGNKMWRLAVPSPTNPKEIKKLKSNPRKNRKYLFPKSQKGEKKRKKKLLI